jgi:hypothetical protein
VPCHTCFLKECPHDNLCVKLVEASEVLEAALTLARRQQARCPSPLPACLTRAHRDANGLRGAQVG